MKLCILATGLAMAFAGTAQAACSAADQAELEALDRAWGEAGQRGDRAALEAIYSDQFMDLAPGGGHGKRQVVDDIVEAAAEAAAPGAGPPDKTSHDFYRIHCDANSALITHRNITRWGEGDKAGEFHSRSVHHLVREGGKWRVLANAGSALDDSAKVRYLDLEWNLAELASDKAWFERNLADDFVGVSRKGKPEDKDDQVAAIGTYKVTQADSTDLEVTVDGDTARATGVYHTRGTDEAGKAFERQTRYIDTFIKRDGRWQIWTSQGTEVKE